MRTILLALFELLFYAALICAVLYSLTNIYVFMGVVLLIIIFCGVGLSG